MLLQSPGPQWGVYSAPQGPSLLLLLYLNIAGLRQCPGKMVLGPGKSWNFSNQESETLLATLDAGVDVTFLQYFKQTVETLNPD